MVHSVYSDREIFVRELVSNAADACEKLRYEAIARPELIESGPFAITVALDPEKKTLTVSDNGVGMTREDLTAGFGTIARSGTKAFLDKLAAEDAEQGGAGADRPVRHRLLFVLHGRRRGRGRDAPRRRRRGLALVVRRQGLVHHRAARARGRARARHAGHPPSQRRLEGILRRLAGRAHHPRAFGRGRRADRPRRQAGRRAAPHRRRRGDLGEAEIRRQAGGIRRVLPRPLRPVRRAGADRALARRRAARIYGARLHPRLAAVRPVRSDAQGAQQALCAAGADHRGRRHPAGLAALRPPRRRQRRPAAQRLARDDPGRARSSPRSARA